VSLQAWQRASSPHQHGSQGACAERVGNPERAHHDTTLSKSLAPDAHNGGALAIPPAELHSRLARASLCRAGSQWPAGLMVIKSGVPMGQRNASSHLAVFR